MASSRLDLALLLLLLASPCLAQDHPFQGDVLDLAREVNAIRSAPTAVERQAVADRLLETLYRDRPLEGVGRRMHLDRWLSDLVNRRPFVRGVFRFAAATAMSGQPTTADVGKAELMQKLEAIEVAFAASPDVRPGSGVPIDATEVGHNPLVSILGRRSTRVVAMESIPGARLLRLNDRLGLSERAALDSYGRQLVPRTRAGRGVLRAGLAHKEVGRAVLGRGLPLPRGAETADVLKGVGPTNWANSSNRFNHKATGTFPMPEAVRDWNQTEILRRAGVAVYEPVAIVSLPYLEWSASEGWRPLAVYVRRPQENLRVSDLDHLSRRRLRTLVSSLRAKIEGSLESAGRTQPITNLDVIRFFTERIGRTAGIFQGGMPGQRYYFHGMLHEQNVSLMGEIVDVGNSDGVQTSLEDMRRAWDRSVYPGWPERIPRYRDLRGSTVETAIFWRMVKSYNERLASVAGGGLSEGELRELFDRAYHEGRSGVSARDPRMALRPAPRARTFERTATSSVVRQFDRTLTDRPSTSVGILGRFRGVGRAASRTLDRVRRARR